MRKQIHNAGLNLMLLSVSSLPILAAEKMESKPSKPNILFIAVDDLKPLMNAYGDKKAIVPGLDRLARQGMAFQNCYTQQAVSGPTRASILTGMRPDKTKVWDLITDFRQVNPNAVSMPEYFIKNGYETAATGKIFHMESAGPGHDAPSWSLPYVKTRGKTYANSNPGEGKKGPATECADVPDTYFQDGISAKGMRTNSKPVTQCEFVDVFPTLCELSGIPIPQYLDGISLVPALKNPRAKLREYAFSQYPRGAVTGYTIRTKRYRYTQWIGERYTAAKPYSQAKVLVSEMYDYEKDPLETKNLIGDKAYTKAESELKKLFTQAMEREHEQYVNYAKTADFRAPICTTPANKSWGVVR